MTTSFPDFQAAPNQGARPDLYELENQALDPDGVVLAAMRELAPWAGRTLVDQAQLRLRAVHDPVTGPLVTPAPRCAVLGT
jgi:hypothetical protein